MYFGTVALARLVTSLVGSLLEPPVYIDFPRIPIDAFNLCGVIADFHIKLIPNSIGTAYGA